MNGVLWLYNFKIYEWYERLYWDFFNSEKEIQKLVAKLSLDETLSENCEYIRFALASALEIWKTNLLKSKDHDEDWYRLHLYVFVWDKADNRFETKRSECFSKTTQALQKVGYDIKNQRFDFILRDLNSETDIITTEEKPPNNGVKSDDCQKRLHVTKT